MRIVAAVLGASLALACSTPTPQVKRAAAPNLLILTVDSLRADRVGAYGYAPARTPAMDALAARGVRFERAYATAPITLTSHVSLMTGRYPPAHGARHNGIRMDLRTTTIGEALGGLGIATGAFLASSLLDRRFGLIKGFQTYSDRIPRDPKSHAAVRARPDRIVVDEALQWLNRNRGRRFFLWVHLFEPHAPHGDPADGRPADVRYDDEVAAADREVGRLIAGLGEVSETIVVLAGDHGEAFSERGEIGHGVFVYDTTLRVPLIIAGPGVPVRTIAGPVSLVDVAPSVIPLLNMRRTFAHDGIDLTPHMLNGTTVPDRELYAESFASMFDFGWSGLRAVRAGGWKYIAAPKPELYDLQQDRRETRNIVDAERPRAASLAEHVTRLSGAEPASAGPATGTPRADPKDRRDLAARIMRVTTGEVRSADVETALRGIVTEDPENPEANLRLAFALLEAGRCPAASKHFAVAIAARLHSVDAHLGLASCQAAARRFDLAAETLRDAERLEPDNPVVVGNLGVVLTSAGRPDDAVKPLQRALTLDPDFHQARLDLAGAFARAGRRAAAAREAQELLKRLPPDAPLRAEAQRLLADVQ